MTPRQLADDVEAALIDPYERLSWWQKRGYRRLAFDYCQPPLSARQEPCDYIDYFVRVLDLQCDVPHALPASVLLEHMRRFFFVSVGKCERDMNSDPNWIRQRNMLQNAKEISIETSTASRGDR